MPTLPPEPSSAPHQESHQARAMAESFGVDAARYDRSRPRYPEAMVQATIAASPGREVLDVGTGTGIVARQFQAAGCNVLGVDPDERMAEFARRHGTEVEVSTLEKWDPAGRTFDLVVAGQVWHWVDPVAGAAKAAEVLRPGGRLALFWNAGQPPTELVAAFAEVYRRLLPDSPITRGLAADAVRIYLAGCDKAADGLRAAGGFGEPEQRQFQWEQRYTRDQWLEFSATTGVATQLPQAALDDVLGGLGNAIDEVGGSFTAQYTAVMVTAARLAT
ncbi:class I SAM-dependent methyltransferase [Nocardia sp. NPDC051321]|uniref:class I SAM-dependent methyltransferase n=1 Tax=Nocardia sp. NPDC051321 TaxID=3364323 RepID=UPI0037A6F40E